MPTFARTRGVIFPDRRPLFYYVTDRSQLAVPTTDALISHIKKAICWGVDFIQLREKTLTDRELYNLTTAAVRWATGTNTRILVNGRVDIALAGGADGVHIPSSGIESAKFRRYLPNDFLIGVSTHSLLEARRAAADGADYILAGPVFRTESKIRYGKPMGLARLRQICSTVHLPVLGLGGIRRERIPRVLNAGASGIAAISLFQCAPDFFSPRFRDILGTGG